MASVVVSLLHSLRFLVRSRASLHLEILALRHQFTVVNRSRGRRLRWTTAERTLWAWLSRAWRGWRSAVHIVRPETVIAWHRPSSPTTRTRLWPPTCSSCRRLRSARYSCWSSSGDRRRIVHAAVTDQPTAAWIAQQRRNAFPEDQAPRCLLHDRDGAFAAVATALAGMNIQTVRTAPRSPWQNAYIERVIGSVRRECLDHVIVANEAGVRRVLAGYVAYYLGSRTHLALAKDSPVPRPVHSASAGRIVATPEVGGLHHRYDRVAA